ncbi:hypothetical protein S7335_3758 [Synechococcus sp. PCC 7335]|nr:hypothetical protein S7335_3758 [Synechococcus sp. PCC 7335]
MKSTNAPNQKALVKVIDDYSNRRRAVLKLIAEEHSAKTIAENLSVQ